MATDSSILAWRIPWTEEPGGLQAMGLQELDTTQRLNNNSILHIEMLTPVPQNITVFGDGWALNQSNSVLRRGNVGTQRHQECLGTEERLCEDVMRRQPSAVQGERGQEKSNLSTY